MIKTFLKLLVAGSALFLADQVAAQTFTVLKDFSPMLNGTNSDGANPESGLTLSGNMLYGTTYSGGRINAGTVFRINTDGMGFAVLKDFDGSDGVNPYATLTVSGNTLYGTTCI